MFSLTINNNGSWTFTDLGPIDHPLGDNTEAPVTLNLSGLVQAVDFDGDHTTLANDLMVTVADERLSPVGGTASGTVDEAIFAALRWAARTRWVGQRHWPGDDGWRGGFAQCAGEFGAERAGHDAVPVCRRGVGGAGGAGNPFAWHAGGYRDAVERRSHADGERVGRLAHMTCSR